MADRSRELKELEEELKASNIQKKIAALNKVICFMNNGKNVSSLFFSVLKCLEIRNVEVKKLVYLYITQYAVDHPQEAIMSVQSFVRDARDKTNSMIRAIAIRMMGCLRVKDLNEYLITPLEEALIDNDAYVKKTAVLTVPKIYELNPELIKKSKILDTMKTILRIESNPFVVSNTLLALHEMSKINKERLLEIDSALIEKILTILPESNEWAQINLIDILSMYPISNPSDVEKVIDRLLSRLSHINAGVVIASSKLILQLGETLNNEKIMSGIINKLSVPLTTLLNARPEVAWVVLRNLGLILDRYPKLFANPKVFFIKIADTNYIKLEKIKFLEKLADGQNFKSLINELNEYSFDPNPEISKSSVSAIWRIALRVPGALEASLVALENLLGVGAENAFADHLVNEAVVGLDLLYRKYQAKEQMAPVMEIVMKSFAKINENSARKAFATLFPIFVVSPENCQEVLTHLTDNFLNFDAEVQLPVLSLCVRVYLKNPDKYQADFSRLLTSASEQVEDPDVRDRLFFYWQLLDLSPEVAKRLLTMQKPKVAFSLQNANSAAFFAKLGSLSSTMQDESIASWTPSDPAAEPPRQEKPKTVNEDDFLGFDLKEEQTQSRPSTNKPPAAQNPPEKTKAETQPISLKDDFFSLDIGTTPVSKSIPTPPPTQPQPVAKSNDHDDFFFGSTPAPATAPAPTSAPAPSPQNDLDLFGQDFLASGSSEPPKADKPAPAKADYDLLNFDALGGAGPTDSGLLMSTVAGPREEVSEAERMPDNGFRQSYMFQCLSATTIGEKGHTGIEAVGRFERSSELLSFDLKLTNSSDSDVEWFSFSIQPNVFGLSIKDKKQLIRIAPGESQEIVLPMFVDRAVASKDWKMDSNTDIHIVLSTNFDSFAFIVPSNLNIYFVSSPEKEPNLRR